MALSGVQISFHNVRLNAGASLLGPPLYSEAPASGVQSAPVVSATGGLAAISMRTYGADVWVAVGPNPDPTKSPRYPLEMADGKVTFFCQPGDCFAWTAA